MDDVLWVLLNVGWAISLAALAVAAFARFLDAITDTVLASNRLRAAIHSFRRP